MFFSIIIPLYNRPQEIKELLQSLTAQKYTQFEVIVVEDGSTQKADTIVRSFSDRLEVRYFYKENEGQGFTRNFGFAQAKGDFFIVFDSDVIVPEDYLSKIMANLSIHNWDAFGGPDAAHISFTSIQKAISYSMTSPFTTGGIRGNKKHVGQFHPRSFNLGISRKVWLETGGFKLSRRSEDIEFSIRMIEKGYKVGLIPEAFVYHKRRTKFNAFYKQTYSFGMGRIDIAQIYPHELKIVHALPACFSVAIFSGILLNIINFLTYNQIFLLSTLTWIVNVFFLLYTILVFLQSIWVTKNLRVAFLSVISTYIQLIAYGNGFIRNYIDKVVLKKL